jgi:uncharacterized protein YbjT (DUF2867 family)
MRNTIGMVERVALLAGASGLVGSALLRLLLADAGFDRVIAIGRRPLPVIHPKLDAQIVDFAALPAIATTDAFCCLGTTIRAAGSQAAFRAVDHDHVLAVARSASGARSYLVSSVGADTEARNFYLRVKGETERDVAALGHPGLDIFRPSLLLGPRADRRPAEAIAQALMPLVNPLLPTRYRAVDHAAVAGAMLAAARLPPERQRIHHVAEILRLTNPRAAAVQ